MHPPEKKTRVRSRWQIAAWILGIALLAYRAWDPPFAPTLSLPPEAPAPAEANAFPRYVDLMRSFDAKSMPRGEKLPSECWREMKAHPDRAWSLAGDLIESRRAWLAELSAASALPHCQWMPHTIGDVEFTQLVVIWSPQTGQLLQLKILTALQTGNLQDAMYSLRDLCRLARHWGRLRAPRESLETRFMANRLIFKACSAAQLLAGRGHTPSHFMELTGLIDDVESSLLPLNDWCALQFRNYTADGDLLNFLGPAKFSTMDKLWVHCFGLYLPNETLRLLEEGARARAGMSDLPAATHPRWQQYYDTTGGPPRRLGLRSFTKNGAGQGIAEIIDDGDDDVPELTLILKAKMDLTRVVVALCAYRARHGSPPAALQDLVPQFLPFLPQDAHDGSELHYDRERGLVYSSWPVDEKGKFVRIRDFAAHTANLSPQKTYGLLVSTVDEPLLPEPVAR